MCSDSITKNIQSSLYQIMDYINCIYKDNFSIEIFQLIYLLFDGFESFITPQTIGLESNKIYEKTTPINYTSQRNLYQNNGHSIMSFVFSTTVTHWFKYDNYIKSIINKNLNRKYVTKDIEATIKEYTNYNFYHFFLLFLFYI